MTIGPATLVAELGVLWSLTLFLLWSKESRLWSRMQSCARMNMRLMMRSARTPMHCIMPTPEPCPPFCHADPALEEGELLEPEHEDARTLADDARMSMNAPRLSPLHTPHVLHACPPTLLMRLEVPVLS